MDADNNKILVIDDEKDVLDPVVKLLKNDKYTCLTARNANQGIELIQKERPMVVLTDLKMDTPTAGLYVLEEAKKIDPNAVVILYTGYGNVPSVVEAFKKGAFDFIQKINTHHDLLLPVERAFKFARMQRENAYLRSRLDSSNDVGFYGAVGTSPIMRQLFEKAKRIAQTNATVLITGETGTGKEVLAKGIHEHSNRSKESFIPVAVGTLPEHLLETELFGHIKGAYTGATTDKQGLFEAADKGTIFLDEIGEVSFDMQHKLLRVLQEKTVRRLGSVKELEIDVRIISATNRDPEELMKEGKMREDLFWRLNVINLTVPPLRDRREDIPVLAYHFLKQYRDTGLIEVERFDSDALILLQEYDWPGNIRELQGLMQRLIALATHSIIRVDDLPDKIRPQNKPVLVKTDEELDFKESKARIIEEFEKNYIENLLVKYNGNITKVADAAKLNRKTIYRLMDARNIQHQKSHIDDD